MKFKTLLSVVVLLAGVQTSTSAFATPTPEHPDRNVQAYSLENGNLGLKGYDPVSFFAEGGGAGAQGSPDISLNYGGVNYNFASEANRDQFLENPRKYESTYGGWCAWAMANRGYAEIDPRWFTIVKRVDGDIVITDGNDPEASRIHFFISRGAKARYDRGIETHEPNADQFWLEESGEQPRL